MGTANAPVMFVPVQNMQQMAGTSGNGLMYVQVPSGSIQENTSSQVPQVTIHPSGPQSSGGYAGKVKCNHGFSCLFCFFFFFNLTEAS